MRRLSGKFKVTTPMFLGGANNWATAELRPTSIKGVMRFWYRAIFLGRYGDPKEVKKREDKIFGSTKNRSNFFLRLGSREVRVEDNAANIRRVFNSPEIGYLGYGLFQRGRKVEKYRPYIPEGETFTVELIMAANAPEGAEEELAATLKALGLFGALGSRSRRGFGSITLEAIHRDGEECFKAPRSREELSQTYSEFYSALKLEDSWPAYTALSKKTRTIILDEFSTPQKALQEVGTTLMNFRRETKADAHRVIDFLDLKPIRKHPKRVAFGLPHNYFIKDKGQANIGPRIKGEMKRRASPLMIKVISVQGSHGPRFIPVMTLFPSVFLPDGSKIEISDTTRGKPRKAATKSLDPQVSFGVIHEFMDVFPNAMEVKPVD